MDYSFLDKEEYKDIPLFKIEDNNNNVPFMIAKLKNCRTNKHRHKYVQIIYLIKGHMTHVINENSFNVNKGDIFIIPPYVPHYFINSKNEDAVVIEFEFLPEFINEKFSFSEDTSSFFDFAYLEPFLVAENEMKPKLNLKGSIQLKVEDILHEVLIEYKNRDNDFELIIKALLLRLLVLIGREYKGKIENTESQLIFERHKERLYKAIRYIDDNFTCEITIEEVAKIAMLSQSYFRYLFKHMTNKTLTEYVNHKRIAKAVDLLLTRFDLKVLDICYEVGFNSINHFNRVFRKETDLTPMMVRKSKK